MPGHYTYGIFRLFSSYSVEIHLFIIFGNFKSIIFKAYSKVVLQQKIYV